MPQKRWGKPSYPYYRRYKPQQSIVIHRRPTMTWTPRESLPIPLLLLKHTHTVVHEKWCMLRLHHASDLRALYISVLVLARLVTYVRNTAAILGKETHVFQEKRGLFLSDIAISGMWCHAGCHHISPKGHTDFHTKWLELEEHKTCSWLCYGTKTLPFSSHSNTIWISFQRLHGIPASTMRNSKSMLSNLWHHGQ